MPTPICAVDLSTEKKDARARQQWVRLLNRKDWQVNSQSRVCSRHFFDSKPTVSNPFPTQHMGYHTVTKPCSRKQPKTRLPPQPSSIRKTKTLDESDLQSHLEEDTTPMTDACVIHHDHSYSANASAYSSCLKMTEEEGVQMNADHTLKQGITQTKQIKEEPEEWSIKQEEDQLQEFVVKKDQLQDFTSESMNNENQLQEFTTVIVKSEDQLQDFTEKRDKQLQDFTTVIVKSEDELQDFTVTSDEQLQEFTTVHVKREEQLQDFTTVIVKSEDQPSLLPQRQTEHREEAQGEDYEGAVQNYVQRFFHLKTQSEIENPNIVKKDVFLPKSQTEGCTDSSSETDNDDDWDPAASSSTQHMETEANGDLYNQVTSVQHSTRKKAYSCSFCEKVFVLKSNLKAHWRTHTGEKPYSCSVCEKTFVQKSHLKTHMKLHIGTKPYSCSVCEKTFLQKGNLNIHMRTHSREKPYSCTICEKTFSLMSTLKQHMKTHTQTEKPFSCSTCKKSFSLKCNLNMHMRTHTGEKPYSCSICKKSFTQDGNLKKHIKTMHTTDTIIVTS